MVVREHRWVAGKCMHCGAPDWPSVLQVHLDRCQTPPMRDERICVPRDDHQDQRKLRPEPKRREYACEAYDAINARLKEVMAEAVKWDRPEQEWGLC